MVHKRSEYWERNASLAVLWRVRENTMTSKTIVRERYAVSLKVGYVQLD
jgi:hypothetical protein